MLLYELLRRQRRREADDDDDDDDDEDEDDWTDETDSEDDETSSSYEDEYDDDDDDDYDDDDEDEEDEDDDDRPRLEPTQLEQLPKVEKKAFCQKWILGQKNVDYLLKEEPLRSPSARLARTPPPTTPSSSSAAAASKPIVRTAPTGLKDSQKMAPTKRKLEDPTSNAKSARIAIANNVAGTTFSPRMTTTITTQPGRMTLIKTTSTQPFKLPTAGVLPVNNAQLKIVAAPPVKISVPQYKILPQFKIAKQPVKIAPTPVKIVRIQNMSASNGVITPAQLQVFRSQQQLQQKLRIVGTTAANLTVPTSTQSPIKVVRVGANTSTPSNGGTYPKLVTTIGPMGFPVKTLLVNNELPAGSRVIVTNNAFVPRLVNSAGQPVKLVELQQQQSQLTSPVTNGGRTVTAAVAPTEATVPLKKPKIEPDLVPPLDAVIEDVVIPAVQKPVTPMPSSSLEMKSSRNVKRFSMKLEPDSGTVLRRSPRLVNARKVYS